MLVSIANSLKSICLLASRERHVSNVPIMGLDIALGLLKKHASSRVIRCTVFSGSQLQSKDWFSGILQEMLGRDQQYFTIENLMHLMQLYCDPDGICSFR